MLPNRPSKARQAHTIILIGGKVEGITQVATGTQPPHWSISANAPRGDGTTLAVSGATADEREPSVGEFVECGIDAGPSWMNTRGLHHRAVLHVAPPQAAPAGRLGGY
jgi:hypothetical protein